MLIPHNHAIHLKQGGQGESYKGSGKESDKYVWKQLFPDISPPLQPQFADLAWFS